jgi:hypothetical protein
LKQNFAYASVICFVLLATMLLLAVSNPTTVNAQATSGANVVINPATGGTTNPAAGSYLYPNGTTVTLTATPSGGYIFQYWVISGGLLPGQAQGIPAVFIDPATGQEVDVFPNSPLVLGGNTITITTNPVNIECGYGYSYQYQAIFAQTTGPGPTPSSTQAVVVVLPSLGGSTNPSPGTYTYDNGANIVLSATPADGYTFQYWVVSGDYTPGHGAGRPISYIDPDTGQVAQIPASSTTGLDSLIFTGNPATVTCGYGYTYNYQPIFVANNLASTTPTVSPTSSPEVSPTTPASSSPTVTPTQPPTSTPVTATPTPSAEVTPTPKGTSGGLSTLEIAAIIVVVVIIIIIIIAVAVVMMRRKK